jgi:CheY-like chemotaxis protein
MRPAARILVAEDDEPSRELLVRILQRAGYEVVTAVDGREAVKVASDTEPDLVLMDLSMPAVDGWEALEWIRRQPRIAGVPIIALTAYEIEDLGSAAVGAGFDDYERKPVDTHSLLRKVAARLEAAVAHG